MVYSSRRISFSSFVFRFDFLLCSIYGLFLVSSCFLLFLVNPILIFLTFFILFLLINITSVCFSCCHFICLISFPSYLTNKNKVLCYVRTIRLHSTNFTISNSFTEKKTKFKAINSVENENIKTFKKKLLVHAWWILHFHSTSFITFHVIQMVPYRDS
jgi:hypothetical protein